MDPVPIVDYSVAIDPVLKKSTFRADDEID